MNKSILANFQSDLDNIFHPLLNKRLKASLPVGDGYIYVVWNDTYITNDELVILMLIAKRNNLEIEIEQTYDNDVDINFVNIEEDKVSISTSLMNLLKVNRE